MASLTATSLTSLARDLTYDSSGKTAVATLSNHGLLAGDRVKVAVSSGPTQYVGIFVVLNVPATDKFRYVMASDPGSGSVTGPTIQKIFGVAKLVIEGNTIELATGSTGQIGAQGWKADTVKPGDKITIQAHPMKDGSRGGQYQSAKLEDGRTLGPAANANPNNTAR